MIAAEVDAIKHNKFNSPHTQVFILILFQALSQIPAYPKQNNWSP